MSSSYLMPELNNAEFLKNFAITLTHDTEKAKDLVQETLCRAITYKEKFQCGTNIKAWLYTIMRNIFINEYRRNVKQHALFDKPGVATPFEYQKTNETASNVYIKEMYEAIYKLPDVFKKPFLLYFDGYKYHEIADILDEPLGTIKSRIYFARQLLKSCIQR